MQPRAPTQPPLGREPLDTDQTGALVTRFGTAVGGGVCAAIAASLPAVLRLGDGGSLGRALDEWLALSAVFTFPALVGVAIFRRGRIGIRILAGDHATALATGVLWWTVLEAGLLSLIGTVLRAKTHHHGLAGVTFAMIAVITGVVSGLIALRGARMVVRLPDRAQRLALSATGIAAFVIVMCIGIRTASAEGIHTASALVDALALAVGSGIGSARGFSKSRAFAICGAPLATLVLLLGLATLESQPELRAALHENAPLHAWLVSLVTGS